MAGGGILKDLISELKSPITHAYLRGTTNDLLSLSDSLEDSSTLSESNGVSDEEQKSSTTLSNEESTLLQKETTIVAIERTGESNTFGTLDQSTNISDITDSTPELSLSLDMDSLLKDDGRKGFMVALPEGLPLPALLPPPGRHHHHQQQQGGDGKENWAPRPAAGQQRLVQGRLLAQEAQWRRRARAREAEWAEERAGLAAAAAAAREEGDRLRAQLQDRKELLRHLELSDARAAQLEALGEAELGLKEFVALRCHRRLRGAREELERARTRLAQAEEEASVLRDTAALKERERARAQQALEQARAAAAFDAEQLGERAADLGQELAAARKQVSELKAKGAEYDTVRARAELAEREWENTKKLLDDRSAAARAAAESQAGAERRAEELEREAAILRVDKEYLRKESDAAQARADGDGRRRAEAERELGRLREDHALLAKQLGDLRDRARTEYEERLSGEVERLRAETGAEAERARALAREAFEREAGALREAAAAARAEAGAAREEAGRLRREARDLERHIAKTESESGAKEAELRNKEQLLRFELAALGAAHEEAAAALRGHRLEGDRLRALVAAHQAEFMNLKNTSDQNERFLEARLTEATERLVTYEKLEVDLDTAILRAGGGNSPQHGGGSGAVGELAGAVPTCPRRRVQQAIQLAQRLVRSEGELTSLKEQKDKLEAEVLEANQRAEVAERELQAVQAPTKYMVDAIRKAESEGSAWKVQVSSLQKEKHQLHHRIQCLEEDNMALRKKLKRALSHQKDIASLKAMIKAMQLEEKSSAAEAVQKKSARAFQSSPELLVDEAQAYIGETGSSGGEQYFPAQMLKTGVDTDQKDRDNGEPALSGNSTLQLPSCQQKMGDFNATGPLETALSGAESPPTMGKILEKMLQHRSERETSAASTEERASFHDEASGIIWHEQKSISS